MNNFTPLSTDHYRYQNKLLTIEVLGGIRLDGLDRMQATLKIQLPKSSHQAIRHSLDLYNDNQVEKLLRKVSERLEVGITAVQACINELIENLEHYRLQERDNEQQLPETPTLNKKQREEAEEFLKQKNLLEKTSEQLREAGIVGEETNAIIIYLAMTSRLLPEPLSVICLAKSGTGKSYLMEKVASCLPKEDQRENTALTENSFYYYNREEIKGKVFLIEDLDGASDVLYPIRELQSKQRITKSVPVKDRNGKTRTVQLTVEGPVSVIGCTTSEKVYEDNANRSILIHLDHSKEQDRRITTYIQQKKAGKIDKIAEKQIQNKLQNVQRILRPIKIINPYAEHINLPKEVFKPRRTLNLLLNFIEAITFYNQYNREEKTDETTGEMYIETTKEDVKQGFAILEDVLFRKSDELSGACRTFYDYLLERNNEGSNPSFSTTELRKERRLHPRSIQRYCKELVEFGYLLITGGSKHKGFTYKLAEVNQLRVSIHQQISQVIGTL